MGETSFRIPFLQSLGGRFLLFPLVSVDPEWAEKWPLDPEIKRGEGTLLAIFINYRYTLVEERLSV